MITPRATNAGVKSAALKERSEYLIDGFRVSFLHQAEWQCDCREFRDAGICRHTREAGGMREAQALIRARSGARGLSVSRAGTQPYRDRQNSHARTVIKRRP